MGWLRDGFITPGRAELATGHHLRPIRAADVDIDLPAVMGARERLWRRYGEAWGWPPAALTREQDRHDLAHHEDEIAAQETFNYAILPADETALLGCLYIDPPYREHPPLTDAVASWWLVDAAVGTPLDAAMSAFVPGWLADTWGFAHVHYWP